MFRGMTSAHDDAPGMSTDLDLFAIGDAAIAFRQGMDVFAEITETSPVVFNGAIGALQSSEATLTLRRATTYRSSRAISGAVPTARSP